MNTPIVAQECVIVFENGQTGVFFGPVVVNEEMKKEGIKVKEIYFIDLVTPPPQEEKIIEPASEQQLADIERVGGKLN